MKLLAKPVDAMVVFNSDGRNPRPYKFKIEEGGELITIGSDAHYGEHLGRGIREGMAIAERCGFRALTIFQHREPIEIPME